MSVVLAAPRDTPKKLPPSRFIFWITCLDNCNTTSDFKIKECVVLNSKIESIDRFTLLINDELTGISDKPFSVNPRKPKGMPAIFLTPYLSRVNTIYKHKLLHFKSEFPF